MKAVSKNTSQIELQKTLRNNFKNINHSRLLENTKTLVSEERRISVEVLQHLLEIERRKAYSTLGYLSLFEYATTELKYSDSAAMRRIQAMRALNENPDLEQKLKAGSLTVSGVARVQSFIRKHENKKSKKWTEEDKNSLFQKLENCSQKQIETALVTLSPESAWIESVKCLTPDFVELKIQLTQEQLKQLDQIKGLLAHQLKDAGSYSELMGLMISMTKSALLNQKAGLNYNMDHDTPTKRETEIQGTNKSTDKSTREPNDEPIEQAIEQAIGQRIGESRRTASPTAQVNQRFIPEKIKRALFIRSQFQCEHRDSKTNIRCTSGFKLEIDHIIPYSLGGTRQIDNLRILCRAHNELRNWN